MTVTFAIAEPYADRSERPVAYWLIATAAMTMTMVVIGGITRLTQSGLSITEWQPVSGILPPLSQAAWQAAFEQYQRIPEYRQVHLGMSLAEFQGIFFWEYLHRVVGRVTGLVALLPPLFFVVSGRVSLARLPRLLIVPLLILLQGALGWYMVESGLQLRTSVSQYRLTAHLTLALTLYAYCVWRAADILLPTAAGRVAPIWRRLATALLALVAVTIAAGGFTAGTKAGLVYNTFPLMDGHLIPEGYFLLHPWWLNPFENVTAVQFDHRALASLTFVSVLGFWIVTRGQARRGRAVDFLAAAVLLQVALGISTLLFSVPIPLAAAHQAGAVILLTAALLTRHEFR